MTTHAGSEDRGIDAYRIEIDEIDVELLALFNRRAACALAIGELKKKTGQPVFVPEREKKVLDKMMSMNRGPLANQSVQTLFQALMDQMKLIENAIDAE